MVGRNIEGFAEEWAAPNRPACSRGEETFDVLSDAVIALAVLGALAHLAFWSARLPASLNGVLGALLMALLCLGASCSFRRVRLAAQVLARRGRAGETQGGAMIQKIHKRVGTGRERS